MSLSALLQIKMNSNFNCNYMTMSSLTYMLGFSVICFSASLFRLGILWVKNHIQIFCSEIWVEMIFGCPTFKIMCNTPIFYFNFRCQIENRVSDYRLLWASSLMWSSWRFSTSNSNYWRPPLIPIDMISMAVTRVKHIFNNLCFILWHVISIIYFPWTVISKNYSSWWDPYLPFIFMCQLKFVNRRHRKLAPEALLCIFAQAAYGMCYQPGCDVMASLLLLVRHMHNCHSNVKYMINGSITD